MTPPNQTEFRCRECGASLAFDPGTQSLKCSHCGALNQITNATGSVAESDFLAELTRLQQEEPTHEQMHRLRYPGPATATRSPTSTFRFCSY